MQTLSVATVSMKHDVRFPILPCVFLLCSIGPLCSKLMHSINGRMGQDDGGRNTCIDGSDTPKVQPLLQHIWRHTAEVWGPRATRQSWILQSSTAAQRATRALYYKLHEEEELGGWGTACKAALGKMEYHVPSCAALTWLAEQSLSLDSTSEHISDCAIKCGIRHFDSRVFRGCAIIDREVRAHAVVPAGRRASVAVPLSFVPIILMKCVKDPIQLSEMSKRVACLQGTCLIVCPETQSLSGREVALSVGCSSHTHTSE